MTRFRHLRRNFAKIIRHFLSGNRNNSVFYRHPRLRVYVRTRRYLIRFDQNNTMRPFPTYYLVIKLRNKRILCMLLYNFCMGNILKRAFRIFRENFWLAALHFLSTPILIKLPHWFSMLLYYNAALIFNVVQCYGNETIDFTQALMKLLKCHSNQIVEDFLCSLLSKGYS